MDGPDADLLSGLDCTKHEATMKKSVLGICNRLQIIDGAVKLYKGTNPEMDSYSAFFDNIRSSGSTGRERNSAF